jgi:hypothetical protein
MHEVSTRAEAVTTLTLNLVEDIAVALDMNPSELALKLLEYREANQ